jgi:hypothetical protein
LNKHNHFTTSYYLLLKKFIDNGGDSKADLSIVTNNEKIGRKTAYAGNFKAAIRGSSVQTKKQSNNKVDPFAHLTPVARRFIENSNIINNRVYTKQK